MSQTLYIATRKSPLALWQAHTTQKLLFKYNIHTELQHVITTGDKLQHTQLSSVTLNENQPHHLSTGKGLFIKEIQESLLNKKAHLAVHSMKDLPVEQTEGLTIGALLPRASPYDVLVLSPQVLKDIGMMKNIPLNRINIESLKPLLLNSKNFFKNPIGTTSARRQLLMKNLFSSELNLQILRGNVDSRLKKVNNNEISAILLAQAGLERLELLDSKNMFTLPADCFIPAAAQGIIAIECHSNNTVLLKTLKKLTCIDTCLQAGLERMVLYFLDGDCNSSIGAHYSNQTLSIIYGKGLIEKNFIIPITIEEYEELKKLLVNSESIYTQFFAKLIQSSFANRIKTILSTE